MRSPLSIRLTEGLFQQIMLPETYKSGFSKLASWNRGIAQPRYQGSLQALFHLRSRSANFFHISSVVSC